MFVSTINMSKLLYENASSPEYEHAVGVPHERRGGIWTATLHTEDGCICRFGALILHFLDVTLNEDFRPSCWFRSAMIRDA